MTAFLLYQNAMQASEITGRLKTQLFGRKIYYFDVIDSTNIQAVKLIKQGGEHGALVIAEEQTEGRGRHGRLWFSEKNKNLLFSLIIRQNENDKLNGVLSLAAALSVATAVKNLFGLFVECKWPNDVLKDGKKFCGILSEAVNSNGYCIGICIGVGLNVNQKKFMPEIENKSVSLSMILGKELDRSELLVEILRQMEINFSRFKKDRARELIEEWMKYSPHFGSEVSISIGGEIISGIAEEVSDDGALIIRNSNGKIKILAGDVSYATRI